jgi:plastocyanin
VLGSVASNWEIVAIAFGVPGLVLGLLLVTGSSGRHAPVWAVAAVAFGVVAAFGFYYAFFRPVPRAAASPSTPTTSAAPAPATSAPGGASCSPSGSTLQIAAHSLAFDKSCLAAPANTAVTIDFNNQDSGIPHNIHIFRGTNAGGASVFAGTIVTGPTTTAYHVPALPAGTYYFHCDVHPTTMHGTFDVP